MIRMYGNIVEVCPYKITSINFTDYAKTEADAQKIASAFNGQIEEIDTSGYAWLDGMQFDTREDALAAAEIGETGYKVKLNAPSEVEKLSAKIDYLSMMSGIDIPTSGGV